MRSPHRETGQASVELVALVALIAVVIAAAAAIAGVGAPTIVNGVTTGFQRALCVVVGERCASLDREACPTLRTTEHARVRATVALFKLGGGRRLYIERRSDGSYLLQLVEGQEVGMGIQASGPDGSGELAGSSGIRVGRSFRVATAAEARALVEELRKPGLPTAKSIVAAATDLAGLADADPRTDSYVLAGRRGLDALGDLGFGGLLGGDASASYEEELGVKISARSKEATVYLNLNSRAGAAFEAFTELTVPGPRKRKNRRPGETQDGKPESPDGGVDLRKPGGDSTPPASPAPAPNSGNPKLQLNNPHPLAADARLVSSGHVAVKLGPGGRVLGVELVGSYTKSGKTHELRARIDPDAPGIGPALEAWRRNPGSTDALRALGAAAADGSALDRRTYAYRAADSRKGKLAARGGLGLGLTLDGLTETQELIEQQSRPVGGLWEHRLDC